MKTLFLLFLSFWFWQNIFAQSSVSVLSERIANYDIEAVLNTENKTITAKEIITWKNISSDSLNEFHFHLYLNAFKDNKSTFFKNSDLDDFTDLERGFIEIKKIKILKKEDLTQKVRFIAPDDHNLDDKTVFLVKTNTLLPPDSTIQFEIEFTAKLPKLKARTGFAKDYFFVGQWFPKIGVYELENKVDSTSWHWNCHQFHSTSEFFADFGVYNVELTVPENYIVGATGILWDEKVNANKTKTMLFKANDVIDFAWTASPNYLVFSDKWNDVVIHFLYQKEHENQVERHVEAIKIALEYMEKHVGKYPYPAITVIDPPFFGLEAGGMEYPMLITVGTVKFLPQGIKIPELTTVHEFIHQYFMGILASNEFEEAWLDEGFTTYFETRIIDEILAKNGSINFMGFKMSGIESRRLGYTNMYNKRVASVWNWAWNFPNNSYGNLVYNKAACVLHTLDGILGRELMDRIIGNYFDKYRFLHPKTDDFIDLATLTVKNISGDSLSNEIDVFLEQAIYGTQICDYAIQSVENKHLEKGKDVESDGIFSQIRVQRLGDFQMPIEILIHFEDGTELTEKWNGKSSHILFSFKGKHVKWAKIDPKNKLLLDYRFENNSFANESQHGFFVKYAEKLMYWLQNFMQFLML